MQDSSARNRLGLQAALFDQGILFTGHMIDAPDREVPRFPPLAEAAARAAIRASVAALLAHAPQATVGVAGGACGGDILFHEVCGELGIPNRMLLALPPEQFIQTSVVQGGAAWVDRFHALLGRLGPGNVRILPESNQPETDERLQGSKDDIWERANLWMMEEVLRLAPDCTLLALWDGQGGDGPGGTQHMVQVATAHGIHVAPCISTERLLSVASAP